ncbi:MAG: substrate-binding domain-containing protein [Candidatus Eremiobacteraeota bacterium]|nr:substrate-binding domain-containing protein [Candidatus Eremiobacteraeota bacterium]
MRKALSTFLLIAVPALSACNSQSIGNTPGGSLLPSNLMGSRASHVRPRDTGAADLHAGGATFPAYAYNLGSQPAGCANTTCTSGGSTPNYAQAPPGSGSLFDSYPGAGNIFYCLTGSGFGRKEFENPAGDGAGAAVAACQPLGSAPSGFGSQQDPLDFVGSDVGMPSTEYATYETNREAGTQGGGLGEPFQIPVIGGPIVIGYRPKDFKAALPAGAKLQLSTWTLCAIANGTVSDWSDPAIEADNGLKSPLPAHAIRFYFRSDNSGTSFLFQTHLNATCHGTWPRPYNAAPYQGLQRNGQPSQAGWTFGAPPTNGQWIGPGGSGGACVGGVNCPANPHFIGESGNPGVLAGVVATPLAVGYLEGGWAKGSVVSVGQALIQNGYAGATRQMKAHAIFVDPTNSAAVAAALSGVDSTKIQYGGGSDGNPVGTSRKECLLYVPPSTFDNPPAGDYPIVGVSYLLFYSKGNGTLNSGSHYTDMLALIKYLTDAQKATYTGGAADTIMNNLEYTPLSASIHKAVYQAATGNFPAGPYHGNAACFAS